MKARIIIYALATLSVATTIETPVSRAQTKHQNAIIDLWDAGKPAFGVYATTEGQPLPGQPNPAGQRGGRGQAPAQGQRGGPPNPEQIRQQIAQLQQQLQQLEAGGGRGQGGRGGRAQRPDLGYTKAVGEALAKNPLYDFIFLNLEGNFRPEAVKNMSEGLRSSTAAGRKTLVVRIPPIDVSGADKTKTIVKQAFDNGADAVTIPHVTNMEEAQQAISSFAAAVGANNVWSPKNPRGEKLGMIMLEDPGALMKVKEVADLPGFSIIACGIGSMGGAIRSTFGDGAQAMAGQMAEAATMRVLEESKRAKIPNMLTANPEDVVRRVNQGFLALLMSGPDADLAIKLGRLAAAR
jgi:2-keto-3-deoxy-L-rhamnonate aldolase RhmA